MYKLPFVKKFLLAYAAAVSLVLIYFIVRMLFLEQKAVEHKSFNISHETKSVVDVKEKEMEEEKVPFILLPKR